MIKIYYYIRENFLINPFFHLVNLFPHSNLSFLNPINSHSHYFFLSMHFRHSFLLISDKLSTRSDKLLCINVIVLLLSSFLIGTEKVIYFSAFSPKHSN